MKVVYMGRKPGASDGLRYLLNQGVDVKVVVALSKGQKIHWKKILINTAELFNISTATDDDLFNYVEGRKIADFEFNLDDIYLIISYLFWKKIKKPLIDLPKIRCINFHAAPLPDYRGFAACSFAIYDDISYWRASAHFIDERFATGGIIKVKKFEINSKRETAFSIEHKTQKYLLKLFYEVIDCVLKNRSLKRTPQEKGTYHLKEKVENLRKNKQDDSMESIERKIRAFWYPPYMGASIQIKN